MQNLKISTIHLSLFVLILSFAFFSCQEDGGISNSDPISEINIPEINVSSSLLGIVTDHNGAAVQGALVTLKDMTVETDINGVFVFDEMTMNQFGSLVTVTKEGFFKGYNFIQPAENEQAYTQVQLVTKELVATFSSNEEASVILNGDAGVRIPANKIVTETGENYNGEVNLYAHWYNPVEENVAIEMPGDLRAINNANEIQQLKTLGMITVVLEDESGNKLNLAKDTPAQLTFPVPSEIEQSAPSTIPLWHFDENSGYWIEEGEATLENGVYVGEVSHFSTWNCDIPEDFVELSGYVVGENGSPRSNRKIIVFDDVLNCGITYTDQRGQFSLKVPKDRKLVLTIPFCVTGSFKEDLDGFSTDTYIGEVTIEDPDIRIINIEGQLLNCSGQPLVNGYVRLNLHNGNSIILHPDDSGRISHSIEVCTDVVQVGFRALDLTDGLVSEEIEVEITNEPTYDFGIISTCEIEQKFFYVSVEGVDYDLNDAFWGVHPTVDDQAILSAGDGSMAMFMFILGELDLTDEYIPFGFSFGQNYHMASCPTCDLAVTFTKLPEFIGDSCQGTLNGKVKNQFTEEVVELTGSFSAIRIE